MNRGAVAGFVRLSRPHFLLGGALMFGLGAAAAGELDGSRYLLGQAMVSSAQLTAHYLNEYADLVPDRAVVARTWFSGGSGVLVDGTLPPVVAWRSGLVTTGVCAVCVAALAAEAPLAAALGTGALVVSWLYSMPPVRLLATGWGEAVTSLTVAGAVPLIGVFAQGGTVNADLAWSIAVLVPVHFGMMLAFELPDLETDRIAAKRVLAVRLGRRAAQRTLAVAVAIGFGLLIIATLQSLGPAGLLGLAAVPAVTVMLRAAPGDSAGVLAGAAVASFVLVATGLIAAFLVG